MERRRRISSPVLSIDGAEVEVRVAESDDAQAIQDLWRDMLAEDIWFIETLEEHVTEVNRFRTELMKLLAQPHCNVWCAELRGYVVGVVRLLGGQMARTRHVASLDIFLAEDVRGQALGRRLMEVLIAYAQRDRILHRLELSVFVDNEAAVRLYESLGFEHEGTRKHAIRESDGRFRDALNMVLWV